MPHVSPASSSASSGLPRRGRTLLRWEVEDAAFWSEHGRAIATRNLWISIPCLLLSFCVWLLFSVAVVYLPKAGFAFSEDQLFWLVALPGLSGATLRIFYSFMVPIFGGQNWTVISTVTLLLPCVGFGLAVSHPQTPYWVFVVLALACGVGSGNFASSMANISFFFPRARKGTALGLNAGLGNLGVSVLQFVAPMVIGLVTLGWLVGPGQTWHDASGSHVIYLQNAGYIWVPFIVLAVIAAYLGMNNLASAKASFREQSIIFSRPHNWIMCWLYTGTFGSFIGFSAGLPLLIKLRFPEVNALQYAFLGPLIGALMRPVGGWMADKLGGARVTLWNYLVMTLATGGVIHFLVHPNFAGFLAMFLLLFLTTGIGNGSVFRMIPVIFLNQHGHDEAGRAKAGRESAAVLGFTSAIAAYGAFVIPKTFGWSIHFTKSPVSALVGFALFYVTCGAITWWFYARKHAACPC